MTTPKKQTNPAGRSPLLEVGPDLVIDFGSVAWAKYDRKVVWLHFRGAAYGTQGIPFGETGEQARAIIESYRAYLKEAR